MGKRRSMALRQNSFENVSHFQLILFQGVKPDILI
jgi:hypothetical protein